MARLLTRRDPVGGNPVDDGSHPPTIDDVAVPPQVAPETCAHIYKLFALGLYDTNHIFRVDRGFVAQVADVVGGRAAKIHDAEYRKLAARTIKGEFSEVRGWIVFFLIGTTGRVELRWCRGLYGRD